MYITDGFSGLKNHASEKIISTFKQNSFEIIINEWSSRNFRFSINNLDKDIDPAGSYVKTTNSGLVISLKKANKSDIWDSLEKKKGLVLNFKNS